MLGARARVGCRFFVLLSLLGGCGPQSPGDGATMSTGPDDSTTTTTDPATTTSATSGTTDAADTGDETTAASSCKIDPNRGICPEDCDFWSDCCKCDGKTFKLDPAAPGCELRMEIVTDLCPWDVETIYINGLDVEEQDSCAGATSGWAQHFLVDDIVVELCGKTCEAYLAGELSGVHAKPFCEAA